MRRKTIWTNVISAIIIICCSAGVGTIMTADSSNELMIAVVSLSVALLALIISYKTFYSIDEVNAISRMDGNVMENPRYRPNILRAVFRFPQKTLSETSNELMRIMEDLFPNKDKVSGAHLADSVQEVADMMVLVPFFIHTKEHEESAIHVESVSKLLTNMKFQVKNFKEISDGSCKLLDETVSLIDAIFAYQNMATKENSGVAKLLEIRGSIFINPVSCILYNNYLGLYLLRRAKDILSKQQSKLPPRLLIESAKTCSADDRSMALIYCNKASDSFKRAKENIGDDMIWNGFICFNLARAEYLKQLLHHSFGDTSNNDWEAYINESICNWTTSNLIIAEHFASDDSSDSRTFLQQALISQENKVRLFKIILQIINNQPLTDHNGKPWIKQYNEFFNTPFFKSIPETDPQEQTDCLVEDIKKLL